MNNLPENVLKYLSRYGSEKWNVELLLPRKFNNIIVIPAIQEYLNIPGLLKSLAGNESKYFDETLILFVINNLESSAEDVKEDNRKSLAFLREVVMKKNISEPAGIIINSGLNAGLVDAASSGLELPEREGGVGLARKIGMDLALRMFDYSADSKKILICLDADCTVENNYITSIVKAFSEGTINAAHVNYEHPVPDSEKDKLAIICYELFLRYYVLGLKTAGSPFAFPAIGSTMICDYESYIRIGGMNKKKAAEDFYFMEKLAKITPIHKIDSTKVYPASRGSWRVPFGTGQRVNRYKAETHEEYLLYDPKSFDVLKRWLLLFTSKEIRSAEEYLIEAQKINETLHLFLLQNSFKESWNQILNNSKSAGQIEKQKMNWFDGFRTLKLIHFLRDCEFPSINMFDALDWLLEQLNQEPVRVKSGTVPPVDIQMNYLSKLRILS